MFYSIVEACLLLYICSIIKRKKQTIKKNSNIMAFTITTTIMNIKFWEDKISFGYDIEKVKSATQDLTKMSDIDQSKDWNTGVIACKVVNYSKEFTKKEAIEMNEIMLYNVI